MPSGALLFSMGTLAFLLALQLPVGCLAGTVRIGHSVVPQSLPGGYLQGIPPFLLLPGRQDRRLEVVTPVPADESLLAGVRFVSDLGCPLSRRDGHSLAVAGKWVDSVPH